ncbi:G-type lectin S-receptor-like serine/threonine-protein kinase At4g27290 isoform X2 [Lotus japonicus]|uniref:G-type lectin S-receptor-like serine/threonine-protein kinase At4g27290 isoform X2 n=1 Tax=Lotus japonicus TaxID=34305 RepID=UPI0025895366|nr:G-type lectin S-receptor-like serine/threonine-protein kinase At4g27290 isoform X2 [Lotus japonicus]
MDKNKVLVIYSFLFCFMPLLSSQNYITVTQNQSIQDDETLVSAEGTFEAGFFGLGNSQRQYFGIWYKSISPRTIVWVANRDAPVQNSTATIKLTDKGNLLILDGSKGIIWSSNGSRAAEKPYMQLLDSGNLVVKDGGKRKKNLIWESFDYPGDTLLAGMKIKSNLVKGPTSYLTSWRNTEDPASGFRPKFQAKWNSFDWPGGCVPMKNLSCQNGDGFLKHTGVKLPDTSSSWYGKNKSLDECGTLCLQNCSCTSYAYLDNDIGGSACLIWFGDILDLSIHPNPDQGQEIYIKVVASELDHRRNKKSFMTKKLAGSLAGIVALVICIIILGLATSTCIQRKKNERGDGGTMNHWKDKREDEDIDLGTIFDFSIISSVTDHFSESNKLGEGGFGPVYKGILANGQEIAVKRLSNASGQGMEEFKNEVKLIARLQHRNLVKLFGCSIHQDEKLLIYEFMHNRSLDYFIFDSTRSKLLDWNKRLQIIDGIARGLLYLHQDSRLRIIHRDLKTSNILLDNEMNPKISDFGLARIFIGDQVEARTKRVMGTYGYMPPEYAVHGSFSIKSDVFSFGVIVLEIISGKKIRKFYDPHHHLNLLSHAWRLWIEGSPLELVDKLFEDSIIPTEILRYIHVALLCVQRRPETRPDMLSIVLMLNGEKELPKPSLPAFYTGKHDPILLESPSRRCSTSVTISLEAR